jgi:hypothetical protein
MSTDFSPRRAALLSGVALLALLACAGQTGQGGESAWTQAPIPSVAATPSGSGDASPGASGEPSPGASAPASPGASAPASGAPSPGGSAAPSPGGSPGGSTIDLEETAALEILQDGEPVSDLDVRLGETYTFRVTNTAGYDHNFFIGTPEQLEANQVADLPGIPTFTEGTREFEYTVTEETAELEFACTVPGHYASMHGSFTVEP